MTSPQKITNILKILEEIEKPLIKIADQEEMEGSDSNTIRLLDDAINSLAQARGSLVRVRKRLKS